MSSAADKIDKIESELEKAEIALQANSQTFYYDLATQHLVEARRILLEARLTPAPSHNQKRDSLCRLALFHLALANKHTRAKPLANPSNKRKYLSGPPQQYTLLLMQGIVEFKSLIEWKNCDLRESLKTWFIEIVDLFEDALNHLRSNKTSAAEHSALAGLLLYEHLCLVAQAEHQISISGLCAKIKLPAQANEIYKVCILLSKNRRKLSHTLTDLNPAARRECARASESAEASLTQAISFFAAENKSALTEKLLAVHKHNATMNSVILTCRLRLNDKIQADYYANEDALETGKSANPATSPADFASETKCFQDLLAELVDDGQLLGLRVKAINKRYENMHTNYLAGRHREAIVLAVETKADLEKLRLLLTHAKLFKNSD